MSDQKICPTCGTEYPLSERFCPRDGTALRSSNPQADLVGTIVADRYHILKKLGEGGMGTVYLAEHVKMGRKAALKVMNPGMAKDADAIARFNREAANASRLNHPNACAIYDFGETPEGLIYLAMEFIEGQSLTDLIEKTGGLPAPRAASIIHQAADALAVAHDYGIVHRDLKPDNIMIAKGRDGSDVAKVVDFGIAKASTSDAQKVTKTGLVVGTPEYMSPEQLAGDKLDGRSDIYSLGLVAFNCLTGVLPFPSNSAQEAMIMRLTDAPKTLAEMRPDIAWPAELQLVMDRALSREAGERYQNAAEFGRDIAKAVENMPAAIAATEGTMVMGAAKTVAGAAAVPPTRVASPGGATRKMEAPSPAAAAPSAAPVAKGGSKMPMIVGAAVVVVGVGFAAMKFLGGGGTAAPGAAAPGAATPATSSPATNPAATNPTADANAAKPQPVAPTGGASGQKSGVATKQSATAPAPAPGAAGQTQSTAPARSSTADDLKAWEEWTDPEKSNDTNAQRAITSINAKLPSLSGGDYDDAMFFLGNAYQIVGRNSMACDTFRKLKATAKTTRKNRAVDAVLAGLCS